MRTINVYLPEQGCLGHIRRGAAIVSELRPVGAILVYHEANIYGARPMITFGDRAMYAYWRMRERYPTSAKTLVARDEVVRIGELDPVIGRISLALNGPPLDRLTDWLSVTRANLDEQLTVKGVRL